MKTSKENSNLELCTSAIPHTTPILLMLSVPTNQILQTHTRIITPSSSD